MASPTLAQQTEDPSVLDEAAGVALFDRQARRLLGISGVEFLRRWDAGEFRHEEDSPEGRGGTLGGAAPLWPAQPLSGRSTPSLAGFDRPSSAWPQPTRLAMGVMSAGRIALR